MDRRDFLVRLARLVGLPASFGAVSVLVNYLALDLEANAREIDNKNLVSALVDNRLLHRQDIGRTEAENILHAFHEAPTGTLMMYYQLFWPLFIRPNELEIVQDIDRICRAQESKQHIYKRWFRIRALPAVAAAHALSSASEETADYLRALIRVTHRQALDDTPNREAAEIIWQNMTAALVRNEANWKNFIVKDLIIDAEEVCLRFLDSKDTVLLTTATAAWQFLLSYERSIIVRSNGKDHSEVRAALDRVRCKTSPHWPWLGQLEFLYKDRQSYDEMLPQISEVIMGRRHTGSMFGGVSELFMLARLQNNYNNYLISEGVINSHYMNPERAKEAVTGSFTLFATYGFSKEEWEKLKVWAEMSQIPLSRDIILYFDEKVFRPHGLWEQQVSEFERGNNPELMKWVPFRRIEDENVARALIDKIRWDTPENISQIVNEPERIWGSIISYTALKEAQHRGLPQEVFAKEIPRSMEGKLNTLSETYRLEIEFIKEEAQQFSDKTMIPVGASPAGMARPGLLAAQEDKAMRSEDVKTLDCSFCSFLCSRSKDIQKVFEDEETYAFLDDYPIAEGHTLVILKAHHADLSSLEPVAAARLGEAVARLSKALKDALGAEYVYVASLGEQVRHVHYHLIPRYKGDKKGFVHFISQRGRLKDADALAARVRGEVVRLRA